MRYLKRRRLLPKRLFVECPLEEGQKQNTNGLSGSETSSNSVSANGYRTAPGSPAANVILILIVSLCFNLGSYCYSANFIPWDLFMVSLNNIEFTVVLS